VYIVRQLLQYIIVLRNLKHIESYCL